jgi:hypothetical protein
MVLSSEIEAPDSALQQMANPARGLSAIELCR